MTTITKLRRPLTRRIGPIVVTMDRTGIEIRVHRCRRSRRFTWLQILSLTPNVSEVEGGQLNLVCGDEESIGADHLSKISPRNKQNNTREGLKACSS